MKDQLIKVCSAQAKKLIRRHGAKVAGRINAKKRFEKRTGTKGKAKVTKPPLWNLSRQFNPFYVEKKLGCYAHTISKSIKAGTYAPKPSLNLSIDKVGSKRKRTISIFTVVDSAVAWWLYQRLLSRTPTC